MNSKAESEQLYRCKTVNCSKSFKNASSLFRHNKCCVDFVGGAPGVSPTGSIGGHNAFKITDESSSLQARDDVDEGEDISDGEIHTKPIEENRSRDAELLCEPEGPPISQLRSFDSMEMSSEKGGIDNSNSFDEGDPISKKMKKQVILNPTGKTCVADSFFYDDLIIDEAQATKLESYSCYAGVPQRDKAGQLFVWVQSSPESGKEPELLCVSRHARLYSQLLGRISSATKKMDSKIIILANSILEVGHSKYSFDFKGLIKWSFVEKLYVTKSTEARKLIQSFSGSASNRMRVIVGLCNASRIGKMRLKYFTVPMPPWVPQLNHLLRSAVLSDLSGENSIRKQFYQQVTDWDGKIITDELVESIPFLRLLHLFHELGYFKASQVNRIPIEGGGDSVKWMSYFDEVEALCAVQAAFSDDFTFLLSENAANEAKDLDMGMSSSSSSPTAMGGQISSFSVTVEGDKNMDIGAGGSSSSASIPLSADEINNKDYFFQNENKDSSSYMNNINNINNINKINNSKPKRNKDLCWSVHVRAMCRMCGMSIKADKDRVCSDAWTTDEGPKELAPADKELAEKIIKLRNYAFLKWQIYHNSPSSSRRVYNEINVEDYGKGMGMSGVSGGGSSVGVVGSMGMGGMGMGGGNGIGMGGVGVGMGMAGSMSGMRDEVSAIPFSLSIVSDDCTRSAALPDLASKSSDSSSEHFIPGEPVVEFVSSQESVLTDLETGNGDVNSAASVLFLKPSVTVVVPDMNRELKRLNTSSEDGLEVMKKRKDTKLLKKDLKDEDDATFY